MQSRRFQIFLMCLVIGALLTVWGRAEAQAVATPSYLETGAELTGRMTPDQKARFEVAMKQFNGPGGYATAMPALRQLLLEIPGDPFLAKCAAEAALNTSDYAYAGKLISGVLDKTPGDWQARGLRARLAAELGDQTTRDAEIKALVSLSQSGLVPHQVTQFPLERVKLGDKSLLIYQSFYPWGNFKVHNYAQLRDSGYKLELRMTLESSDFDQPSFAKEHPEAVAAGERRYSYDGYRDQGMNAQGQHSEMHMTFGFVDKKPTYDEVKARFIQIAEGQNKPSSSTTHPIP